MTSPRPVAERVAAVMAAYPALVVALYVIHLLAPQRNGPLAISEVFAPHFLLPGVALIPLAIPANRRALRLGLAVAFIVGAVRFGPGLVSLPAAAPAQAETVVTVLSWNLEAGGPDEDEVVDVIRATEADIVAFQELTPDHATALTSDPLVAEMFPYRAMTPRPSVTGIGLLSRWPITTESDATSPVRQEVVIAIPDVGDLTILNAHPFPPRYQLGSAVALPLGYDATTRDADLVLLASTADRIIGEGRRVLVVGDFNVTDREPGYEDLVAGLWDAHRAVGQGPGSTWRPRNVEFLPFGILRIDYLLGGPGTRPLSTTVDCTPRRTDHCILHGTVAIE